MGSKVPSGRVFPRGRRFSAPRSEKSASTHIMSTATKHDQSHNSATAETGSGYLEISEKGFGFLRTAQNHFHPKPTDIFVTPDTIKRSFLREGSLVAGP